MLQMMRDNAGSWVIKILLGVIVLVFIFLGLGPDGNGGNNIAAEVNKTVISWDDYRLSYNQLVEGYRRQLGGNLSDDMIRLFRLREQAIEGLISNELMIQEAANLDLVVTDAELQETIMGLSYFQTDGAFDQELYDSLLRQNGLTRTQFESQQRQALLLSKLRTMVESGVQVTEGEAQELYKFNNTEVSVRYALINSADQAGVTVDDAAVASFFEENGSRYQSESELKISFLKFAREEYLKEVTVTDEEVAEYYDENRGRYQTAETVEARHILIKLEGDATEAEEADALSRAKDVYAKASLKDADFSALATELSEGPSKDDGGYLGSFQRDAMVKPFADKAFSMEDGEVSEPVRTQFGWHIIKVEKKNPATEKALAEVKAEIRAQLLDEQAETQAYNAAEDAFDMVLGSDSLMDAAAMADLNAVETDFFTRSKGPASVASTDKLSIASDAFGLGTGGISDILEYNGTYYILQALEQKSPEVPELETVLARVTADALAQAKEQRASQEASDLVALLKEGKDFPEGINAIESPLFKRDGTQADGLDRQVVEASFSLTAENPSLDAPINSGGGFYVVQLRERVIPTLDGFDDEADDLKAELLNRKRGETFSVWLEELRSKAEITKDVRFSEPTDAS